MGKSRYAKTKSAGSLIGITRYGKQVGQKSSMVCGNNRQTRRLLGKK